MNANNHEAKKFPDVLSFAFGAILATVVLVAVYFVFPIKKFDESSDGNTTTQTPRPDSSTNSNLSNKSEKQSQDSIDIRYVSDLLTNSSSKFDRYSALFELANSLNKDALLKLIDDIKDFEIDATNERWRSDVLFVLCSRLIHIDVDRVQSIFFTLSENTQRDLAYGIANEWSSMDLEGVSKFVNSQSNPELRMIASNGALDAQSALLSLDALTALAQEFKNEEYIADFIERNLFIEEARHPEWSWKELVQNPSLLRHDNVRRISNIAEAWVKQSGVSVIPQVTEAIKDQGLQSQLQHQLLRIAAAQDVESAFEYAMSLPKGGFSYPAVPVVSIWAKNDPFAAWERLSAIDVIDEREKLTQRLFSDWVNHDAQSLLGALSNFPHDVQDVARVELLPYLFNESTERARAMYDDIEHKSSKLAAARMLAFQWGRKDGEAALDWVVSDASTELERPRLISSIISQMAQNDFQKAFDVAKELPIGADGNVEIGAEATVINMLAFRNLEDALKLLPLVREGPTKLAAHLEVGHSLIRQDRLAEAIANGNELKGEYQIRYYTSIGSNINVMEDSESIFAMLDKLPSKTARSRIATTQLSNSQRSNVYDDDQIERLKEYLTNEDRMLLKNIVEEGIDVPDSYYGY